MLSVLLLYLGPPIVAILGQSLAMRLSFETSMERGRANCIVLNLIRKFAI